MSEIKIRASSWPALFDCAYRWEGTHFLGLPNFVGMRAVMGNALHASTAAFDQGRIDHAGITPDDTAGVVVDKLRDPGEGYRPQEGDPTLNEAERVCLSLHATYCMDWSPRYQFSACELTTKPMHIDCDNGVIVTLTGTLDRSRAIMLPGHQDKNKDRIIDLKSGATAVQKGRANTKKHKPQLGTYQLLHEHTTGREVDDVGEIIGLKTKGKPEVQNGEISGAREAMLGTDEEMGLIQYAAAMFRSGLFPPNPSSFICSPKYCPRWDTCIFHD